MERDNHGESRPGGDNLTILAALQQVARSDATARVIPVSHPAEDGAVQFQFVDLALEDSSWQLIAPEQVGGAVKIQSLSRATAERQNWRLPPCRMKAAPKPGARRSSLELA